MENNQNDKIMRNAPWGRLRATMSGLPEPPEDCRHEGVIFFCNMKLADKEDRRRCLDLDRHKYW